MSIPPMHEDPVLRAMDLAGAALANARALYFDAMHGADLFDVEGGEDDCLHLRREDTFGGGSLCRDCGGKLVRRGDTEDPDTCS